MHADGLRRSAFLQPSLLGHYDKAELFSKYTIDTIATGFVTRQAVVHSGLFLVSQALRSPLDCRERHILP